MKKSVFIILAIILAACATTPAPQVTTATPEVTVTSAPIPTPTFHPQFAALQEQIAASGTRFTLSGADGLVYDDETPIPGLTVSPDGAMTLTVNGETVTLDHSDVTFDDENGISIDGYELDENGKWVEAVSEAMQQTTALLDQYSIDPETVTVTEASGAVNVTDNETGTVLIRTIGEQSKFDLGFAVDTIAKNSCEPTDFKPGRTGLMLAESVPASSEYLSKLIGEVGFKPSDGMDIYRVLIDRENKCWGFVIANNLFYRDGDGVGHKLSLFALTEDEIQAFRSKR